MGLKPFNMVLIHKRNRCLINNLALTCLIHHNSYPYKTPDGDLLNTWTHILHMSRQLLLKNPLSSGNWIELHLV
ncbi:hypothetical protein EUGRSUZ_J01071 [Eucalyptus grandis]|uniref:Uncharacterized protein n=2 Tax=Eucalyptus grandis TaxID=71139 RepID=A0ACC3J474_EUCGR|nr:hypothetical protein EUGRSUZ_J01071 [Eucalyptus grandis]